MRCAGGSAPALLLTAVALLAHPAAVDADINPEMTPWLVLPDTTIAISTNGGSSFGAPLFVESAEFGTAPDGGPLRVYAPPAATDPYGLGCGPLPALPAEAGARGAYALSRGVCPFSTKAANAAAAGAAAVLILDTPAGAYINAANTTALNATNVVAGSCYYDCAAGAGAVTPAEAANVSAAVGGYPDRCSSGGSGCDSGVCLLTGAAAPLPGSGGGPGRQVCCAVTNYLPMQASSAADASAVAGVQAVFLPAGAAAALQAALVAAGPLTVASGAVDPVVATLTLRPVPAFDPAGVLMVLLGTGVAALASFYAGWPEREAIRCILRGEPPPVLHAHDGDPSSGGGMELGPRAAVLLLFAAVLLLGGLFALIQLGVQVVFIVMALFFFGASSSVATVVVRPLIARYLPTWEKVVLFDFPRWGLMYTTSRLASLAVGWAAAGLFLAYRHAGWSWLLQDSLGTCLCCLFLASVRISSLRTATLALSAFFVYDIFMVFITPWILGSSVMVEVATSGATAAYPFGDQGCYCRASPGDTTYCRPQEYMPILLRLPRMADYRGGYAMLGLGDIVIPGLALAMALRQDYYAKRAAVLPGSGLGVGVGPLTAALGRLLPCFRCGRGIGYYPVALIGYAVGLSAANAAVALMQMGQPALLYLVPCIMGPLVALAWRRGELAEWWRPLDDSGDVAAATAASVEAVAGSGAGGGAPVGGGGVLGLGVGSRAEAAARSNSLLAQEFAGGDVDGDGSDAAASAVAVAGRGTAGGEADSARLLSGGAQLQPPQQQPGITYAVRKS